MSCLRTKAAVERALAAWVLSLAILLGAGRAAANDDARALQLEVYINGIATQKIAAFLQRSDQRISASRSELAEIGIKAPGDGDGDQMIPLGPGTGLAYRYDEAEQKIDFTLGDEMRVRQLYDGRPAGERVALPRPDLGAAVNYTLFGSATKALGPGFTGFSGGNASLDARVFGPLGTLTQTGIVGSTTLRDFQALRLDTTWTYSDPESMVSYRAGDAISGGLAWTRSIRLGGLQMQRSFGLRPDLVTLPLPSYSGSAAVPSTVDVYVNSVKTLSQPVAPGPFQISNLPLLSGGGTARVVVQDAAGHAVETSLPYFTSPLLLREGLTDFSVEAGAPRLNYAVDSNDYLLRPAASASARHGFYDWLTLEGHAEGGAGVLNAGTGLAVQLKSWGVLSLAASASRFDERFGFQTYASFNTQLFGISFHAASQRSFGPYNDLSSAISRFLPARTALVSGLLQAATGPCANITPPRALDTASIGLPLFDGSSLSLGYIHLAQDWQKPSQILSLSYSRPVFGDAIFHVSAFTDLDDRKNVGIFAGLSIPLSSSITASSEVSRSNGHNNYGVEAAKSMQPETGSYGWRVRDAEGALPQRSAAAGYRASAVQVGGEIQQFNGIVTGTAQAQGAVAFMDGGVFFSNRIDDAFAVIDAGLPGIEVLYENRPVGKTGSDGKLLLPDLRSYQKNQVAIDARDLPVNAQAPSTQDVVAPADRAGVVVKFGIRNDNAAAMLRLVDKENKPIAVGATVRLENSEEAAVVGYDGETYLSGLAATNTVVVTTEKGDCRAAFPFTPDAEHQVVIGPLVCQ